MPTVSVPSMFASASTSSDVSGPVIASEGTDNAMVSSRVIVTMPISPDFANEPSNPAPSFATIVGLVPSAFCGTRLTPLAPRISTKAVMNAILTFALLRRESPLVVCALQQARIPHARHALLRELRLAPIERLPRVPLRHPAQRVRVPRLFV